MEERQIKFIYESKFAKFLAKIHKEKVYCMTISKSKVLVSGEEGCLTIGHKTEEIQHCNQFERLGWWGMVCFYFWQLFLVGYKRNRLEVEAKNERLKAELKEREGSAK